MRLNVGSGQRPFKFPWINVDKQEKWKPDVISDINHMPMFQNNTADFIVAHHVLEHMGCGESDSFLNEAHRILRPEGSLLIFVPDLRKLAQRWLLGQIDDYIYKVNVYGAFNGDEADRHKWGWSQEGLELYVKTTFSNVRQFDWRPIQGADIAHDWWIAAVECRK